MPEEVQQSKVPLKEFEFLGASRFFKLGDSVTDCAKGGRVGIVVAIDDWQVTVDWGLHTSTTHYTDLDHAE